MKLPVRRNRKTKCEPDLEVIGNEDKFLDVADNDGVDFEWLFADGENQNELEFGAVTRPAFSSV